MKKLSLAILTLICSTMLNGCNNEKVTGSDAAKLLLAEERLDADELKNTNFNLKAARGEANPQTYVKRKRTLTEEVKPIKEARKNLTGVEVDRDGDKVTWRNFKEYSNSVSYFESFVNNIESSTEEAAKLVEQVKDKNESNNVWVKSLSGDRLLQVSAEEDVIMRKYDSDSYQIVTHTLSEQGIDTYDIFTGTTQSRYGMRTRKIGNQRYEYSYVSPDGSFEHYFIADKSRGYWVVISPVNSTDICATILKDDMCYQVTSNVETQEVSMLDIISSDQQSDIFRINYNTFEIFAGAISNIDTMTTYATDSEIVPLSNIEDYGNCKLIYNKDDKSYSSTGEADIDVNLSNGKTLKEGDTYADGMVSFSRGLVSGNADGMIASFDLVISGDTIQEKISNLDKFVKETGITFVRDYNTILESIQMAYNDGIAAAKSITWNDININSTQAYSNAYAVEREKLTSFVDDFNEVKDNVTLSKNQQGKLDKNTKFPYITKATFSANYTDNLVNIESATTKIEDFVLFEQGKKYNMQFALAQYSEENEGYFDLIPIDVNNSAYVPYNGEDELTLTTHQLSFALPVPAAGTYELVTYIADEEGIRVSRPQPINFENVEASEVSVHNHTAQISKTDENLLGVTSVVNNNVVLKIQEPQAQYSYSALYQMLSAEAFNYGVLGNEKIEVLSSNNTWVALTGNETLLNSGTYRLAFKNADNQQAYVSTTY